MGTLDEYTPLFMIISRSILLRMINVSDKSYRLNPNTYLCSVTLFRKSCIYEIIWKNTVQPNRPQIAFWYAACALHAG